MVYFRNIEVALVSHGVSQITADLRWYAAHPELCSGTRPTRKAATTGQRVWPDKEDLGQQIKIEPNEKRERQ